MPSIAQPSIILQVWPTTVGVIVKYTATFSPIELFLIGNGLVVEEHIHLVGDDEALAGGGALYTSPPEVVAPAAGETVVARRRHFWMSRESLQEDPSTELYETRPWGWGSGWERVLVGLQPDDDELVARIQLTYAGLQSLTEMTTPVAVLAG